MPAPDTVPRGAPERILRRVEWRVLRRLEGRLQGDYHTLLRGEGTDFRDLREHRWGDDVRHIDWNATARMDELLVREFSQDRELTAWLLLDRSPSMAFGTTTRTKEQVLCDFTATLAQLLVRGGNRVGAIVYDGAEQRILPPLQGRNQVHRLVHELLKPVQGGSTTDLGVLLETAARLVRRRSLLVLISDFISEPGWQRPLLRLTERNEVVAIRLVDPSEYDLPDAGLIYVQDAETGEQLLIDSSDPVLRHRLGVAAQEQEEMIRRDVARSRVHLHTVSTGDDLVSSFVRLAESNRGRRT